MDILVVTIIKGPSQLAHFRFGVSIHALSILEQLDFEEGKPVFPDGSEMTEEDIEHVKKQGAIIPRTVRVDVPTMIDLLSKMDPNREYEELPDEQQAALKVRGDMFLTIRKVITGALSAIADEENVAVLLALMPVIDHFHGPSNTDLDEDNAF